MIVSLEDRVTRHRVVRNTFVSDAGIVRFATGPTISRIQRVDLVDEAKPAPWCGLLISPKYMGLEQYYRDDPGRKSAVLAKIGTGPDFMHFPLTVAILSDSVRER